MKTVLFGSLLVCLVASSCSDNDSICPPAADTLVDHSLESTNFAAGRVAIDNFPDDFGSIAAADMNADGHLDLVMYGLVGWGNGSGRFRRTDQGLWQPGIRCVELAIADLNGDGNMDFVAGASWGGGGDQRMAINLNNGDGTFAFEMTLFSAYDIAIADFDGDGALDIAGAEGSRTIVLRANGDGTFGDPVAYGTVPTGAIATGDINGDGILDLVVGATGTTTVNSLLGRGDGSFVSGNPIEVGSVQGWPMGEVLVHDLDNDGSQDLIVAASSSYSVVLGSVGGPFAPPLVTELAGQVTALSSGDFNGDGILDLVTQHTPDADPVPGNTTVWLGAGDGTFVRGQAMEVTNLAMSIAVGDADEDDDLDIILTDIGSRHVVILAAIGDGTFAAAPGYGVDSEPVAMSLGDFNGDHIQDLVAAGEGAISVLPGDGRGAFMPSIETPSGPGAEGIVAGDFDGDGLQDVVVSYPHEGLLELLSGSGNGNFSAAIDILTGGDPGSLAVADLNLDGHPDLVALHASAKSVTVLLGRGDGSFQPAIAYGTYGSPQNLIIADLDGDGDQDLAMSEALDTGDRVVVQLGVGDGTFAAALPMIGRGDRIRSLVACDMNGDDILDLVFGHYSEEIGVMAGNGIGEFELIGTTYTKYRYPRSLVAGDFNGDGLIDVAAVDGGEYGTPCAMVFCGHGDGTLTSAEMWQTGTEPATLASADLDRNGTPDLIVASRLWKEVRVLLNVAE